MAITTFDGWIASNKQTLPFAKTSSATSVAAAWQTLYAQAGYPSAGTLNVGNTANGLVPTDATTGFQLINAFSGANKGYLSKVSGGCTVTGRFMVYDRLFHAGAYAFNANTTLASQPSYASRLPGTNYVGTEIWVEVVTAMTGALAVTITYTNQAGTTGRTTGSVSIASGAILGRMFRIRLQAGDTGVQKIESVVGATASAGTFNVLVIRPLFSFRCAATNGGGVWGPDKTGLPEVFADSAIQLMMSPDSTSTGTQDIYLDIVDG